MYIDPRTKLKAKKWIKSKNMKKNRRSPHASFLVSWLGSPHSFLISNKFISTEHSLLKRNLITSGFCLMYSIISVWFSGKIKFFSSVQFSHSAVLTLFDPMNLSTPGLPVHHQFPEFTQTHVLQVGDAIQPSHPLSSPSPPAPNPSQHKIFKGLKTENLSLAYLTNIIAPRELLDSASLVWSQALRHPSVSLTRTCAHVPSAWKVHSSSPPSHPDNFPLIS